MFGYSHTWSEALRCLMLALAVMIPFGAATAAPDTFPGDSTQNGLRAEGPGADTSPTSRPGDAPPPVAVLPLTSYEIDSTQLDRLTARFEQALAGSGACRVVARRADTLETAGAALIVRGELSTAGGRDIVMAVRVDDVESGRVLHALSRTCPASDARTCVDSAATEVARRLRETVDAAPNLGAALEQERELAAMGKGATDTAGARYISVLPIVGEDFDQGILRVLADDFRKSLLETGVFQVMERELMEEIFMEQDFQMSDQCDQTQCVVEAGKIIGVSRIVSTTVSRTGTNRVVISARLVDVATAQVVASASQEERGAFYEAARSVLANLATALAGAPNDAYTAYLEQVRRLDDRLARRFSCSALGFGAYPVYMAQQSERRTYRELFATNASLETNDDPYLEIPSDEVDVGGGLSVAVRLWRWLFVESCWSLYRSQWKETTGRLAYTLRSSTEWNNDSLVYSGPYATSWNQWDAWTVLTGGIGAKILLLQTHNFSLGLTVGPQYGYVKHDIVLRENYSWTANVEAVESDSLFGLQRLAGTTTYQTEISGHGIGYVLGPCAEYAVSPRVGIELRAELNGLYVFGMKGAETRDRVYATRAFTDATTTSIEEHDTYDVVLVRRTDAATGIEYFVPVGTDAVLPEDEETAREWCTFRMAVGINIYF